MSNCFLPPGQKYLLWVEGFKKKKKKIMETEEKMRQENQQACVEWLAHPVTGTAWLPAQAPALCGDSRRLQLSKGCLNCALI